ncbi:DNA-binding protein [Metabacillus indicus LMG 22858]|nr:DNA-binding protein [Metabacillus indicus LMG 22858]
MFRNLEAEMARRGITKLSLAKRLGMRYPTLIDKLNGKYRLYFEEALRIRQEICPEMDLDYLFATTKNQSA